MDPCVPKNLELARVRALFHTRSKEAALRGVSTVQDVYLVKYTVGSDWIAGTHTRQQPGYRAHADYLNEVDKTNRLVVGGPLADYSQVQLAIEASSADEVRELLRDDPWQQKDMLRIEDITKWLLLVDPRMNRRK